MRRSPATAVAALIAVVLIACESGGGPDGVPADAVISDDGETWAAPTVPYDGFEFSFVDVDWDAAEEAEELNMFFDEPEPGYRYIWVRLRATRVADTPEALGPIESAVVHTATGLPFGPDGVPVGLMSASCLMTPESWDYDRLMQPGESQDDIRCLEVLDRQLDREVAIDLWRVDLDDLAGSPPPPGQVLVDAVG